MIRDPNEVRKGLGTGGAAKGGKTKGEVLASITASYFFLRRGLAFMAIAFPFILWALAGFQDSLSAYYHCARDGCAAPGAGAGRDVLTGVLLAAGTFLFFYKGYRKREDWALNLAGLAAAGVAFFPCDFDRGAGEGRTLIGKIHFTSGLVFFLALAFVCLFCAKDTLDYLKDEAKKLWFKRIYAGLGMAMVVVPLTVLALHFMMKPGERSYYVLAIEVVGLFVFAAFWLFKSKEIALIERQHRR